MSENCPDCRDLAEKNSKLAELVSALTIEHREVVLEKHSLKGQITKQNNTAQVVEDIGFLLELWLELCATPRQRKIAAINVEGDRGKVARSALKSKTKGKREEKRDRCADAIRGKALRPYESYGKWYAAPGPRRTWKNDVEHALGSEKKIEEHAGYWEYVQSTPVEWKDRAWQAAAMVERHFQSIYFDAVIHPNASADRDALVEPGLSVMPGTFVELPQQPEKRPKLFVVPDPESEAA